VYVDVYVYVRKGAGAVGGEVPLKLMLIRVIEDAHFLSPPVEYYVNMNDSNSGQPLLEQHDGPDISLPPKFIQEFFHFQNFNEMQSRLFQQAYCSDLNMVVAAPTGSGKTVVMELAILRLVERKKTNMRTMKVVYIAPNKALCQQTCAQWCDKFHNLNLSVLEVTGDIDLKDSLRTIARANIVITTPEKWDSLTRSWRDHVFLMGTIDLLLVDEIHHLGEDRGPVLEMVIVRMRIITATCVEKSINTNRNVSNRHR
jgi:replicative superfamily II helicase